MSSNSDVVYHHVASVCVQRKLHQPVVDSIRDVQRSHFTKQGGMADSIKRFAEIERTVIPHEWIVGNEVGEWL